MQVLFHLVLLRKITNCNRKITIKSHISDRVITILQSQIVKLQMFPNFQKTDLNFQKTVMNFNN